jgi:hypothetical protein
VEELRSAKVEEWESRLVEESRAWKLRLLFALTSALRFLYFELDDFERRVIAATLAD